MNNQIWKTLAIQLVLSGIYVSAMSIWDEKVMLSALVGCLACLIPNSYFYFRMIGQSENNDAEQWLGYEYRFEFGKWVMAGIIFALAFTSNHPWDPLVFFSGYVLIQISGWFVLFVIKGN